MHKIAAAAMPGRASGKVTSRHVSNGVPPRLSEASSMEGFKPSNTLCSVRMTKDRLIDTIPINTAERSEEHTPELQSLMRNSYAVFCLTTKKIYPLCSSYTAPASQTAPRQHFPSDRQSTTPQSPHQIPPRL